MLREGSLHTVCRPVQEVVCHKACGQACKQICEQRCREVCETHCVPVCETCYKEVCCETCRPVCETCMKQECCTTYTNCVETCMKDVCKKVCKPVCSTKTVEKKCGEWVEEQYCVKGMGHLHFVQECGECCFDPCTCQAHQKPGRWKLCWEEGCPETRCRKVWHEHTVCETVPCTTYTTEYVHEQVPTTVCKRVPHTEVKQVPYTVTHVVREHTVKKVPYTVTHYQTEVCKKQVPYTVSRCAKGAYVDTNGVGHECENGANGEHYAFQEGAHYETTTSETVCHMVRENVVKKVPVTVYKTVQEECVKQVPYTVTRMVPHTVKKCVPVTVCEMVSETVCKKVPVTTCHMESYTVCKRVPVHGLQAGPVHDPHSRPLHGDGVRAGDALQKGAGLHVRGSLRQEAASGCGDGDLRSGSLHDLRPELRLRKLLRLRAGGLPEPAVPDPHGLRQRLRLRFGLQRRLRLQVM